MKGNEPLAQDVKRAGFMLVSSSQDASPKLAYWRSASRLTWRGWGEMVERRSIAPNLAAALTVTLVALPLNLALAIACGLPPSVGLVTGAIAGLVCALFGGSRFSITGPEIALAPITLEIVARHGVSGLFAATFMAGMFQVAFGVFRVGGLVNAIPLPVVGGFLAAVGLLVFDAQLPRLLGLPTDVALLSDLEGFSALRAIDLSALSVGALVVLAMVFLPRLSRRVPAPLAGLTLAVGVVALFGVDAHYVEPIEAAWPLPALPAFARVDLVALLPEALALALLASIDSLLCAVSIDALVAGDRTRTDQELCAQGLANMASACFGGMPVAAAVVRSVAAVEAGATTRLTPVVQSLLLALVLLVFAPLVSYVPLVSLAAILLVVGFRLIQWRTLSVMWRVARFEAFIFVVTAAGILFTDFVIGVAIGVVGALAYFARQQGAALRAMRHTHSIALRLSEPLRAEERDMPVIHLEGPLFFGSQTSIDETILSIGSPDRVLVDVSKVSTIDVSGAMALAQALKRLAEEGTSIWVSGHEGVLDPVLRWGLEQIEHERIFVLDVAHATFTRSRESQFDAQPFVRRKSLPSSQTTGVYPSVQIERS